MTLKLNFGNREKLVPTRIPTRTFKFKFGMQGPTCMFVIIALVAISWPFKLFKCDAINTKDKDLVKL